MVEDPPEEAYGRVTNPERFAPLVPAAEELIADLQRRFDVTVTLGPGATDRELRTMKVTPTQPDQAPLTITVTSFPGVYVAAGAWQQIALPACGCDACDEDADDAVQVLHEYCTAVVEGQLFERITGRRILEHTWKGADWSRSGKRPLSRQRAAALRSKAVQPPSGGHWRPWSVKTSS
ncbi:hypothetical protein SAMN05421642_10838 [Rhodococcoides kyotonense]|uniref:Uncharacterized protein n=1 Tax=Rhodococcoides kyotonense TaxID=398843 RepID=A0A239J5H2_9NOCA|nr:hypothetical protein SAMN05421642_10838 [Rhodococcus kyotonensis]